MRLLKSNYFKYQVIFFINQIPSSVAALEGNWFKEKVSYLKKFGFNEKTDSLTFMVYFREFELTPNKKFGLTQSELTSA